MIAKGFSTIKDVAKEARVSFMTVSRVINNSGYVSKNTREKVLKAVKKLNYHYSGVARKLKSSKTGVISIIVPDITNYFYGNIIKSVEDIVRNNDLEIMIFNSRFSAELEKKFLNLSVSNRVEGIVLSNIGENEELIKKILGMGIPVILMENYFKDINADYILHDNFKGTYMLTEHLIKEHNHKKIGFMTYYLKSMLTLERLNGYKQALMDNNIKFDEDLILCGKADVETGYDLAKLLISENKDVTALICSQSIFEIGVLKAFKELDIKVPQDIAFVTFYDRRVNSVLNPSITTLKKVGKIFGNKAGKILLKRITEEKKSERSTIIIPAELLIRESCGCSVKL